MAVIACLLRLGLRCGEVAALRLEDIEWVDGTVRVRGKGTGLTCCRCRTMSGRCWSPTFAKAAPRLPIEWCSSLRWHRSPR